MNPRWRPQLSRRSPAPAHRRRSAERGSAAVELVLIAPVLVGLILTVVGGGRFVDARGQVNDAAYAAARAASLATATDPVAAAHRAASSALADRGQACTKLTVSMSGSRFEPGGQARATLSCTADLSDVVGFGLPGTKRFSATAVVPIEVFRSGTPEAP